VAQARQRAVQGGDDRGGVSRSGCVQVLRQRIISGPADPRQVGHGMDQRVGVSIDRQAGAETA
jgi:hypothetical protein